MNKIKLHTVKNRMLDIVTCISNPMIWDSRADLAEKAINTWLQEPNVRITVVECTYGGRGYELEHLSSNKRVRHIPVKAKTLLWNKECLLNVGIRNLPANAKYVCTADADITWRKAGWATDIINSLDLSPVIQPWQTAYDLGPNDEHIWAHRSFASLSHAGKPVVPRFDEKTLNLTNDPYQYPHPGYVWAWVIEFIEWVGGLFELGGVGSGDHHMALSLVGNARMSIPRNINTNYEAALMSWQRLASEYNGGIKLGYSPLTIEHMFHGRKENRGYNNRWKMFIDHEFDPVTDIKRNIHGVLEFSGNKPVLEAEWNRYLLARNEDVNTLV
jgi:hypothetical protein